MPITRIQITNMAGFSSEDFALPMVCLIQGGNGVGKTGLLDCIRVLGESGHDPDIIHGGATEGETILTLDDEMQLRVRVTRSETWRGWKPKDGKRWLKGRDEIDKIYRAIAYDPMKFLELPTKKQAETLAALSPVQATEEEIRAAVGDAEDEANAAKLREGMTGLEVINVLAKTIYDARTSLNVGADTQEKHASELEKTLPPATLDGVGWEEKAKQIAEDKQRWEADERILIADIGSGLEAAKSAAQAKLHEDIAHVSEQIDAKIAELEKERSAMKDLSTADCNRAIETARTVANQSASEIKAANKPTLDRLSVELGIAQERARAQQHADGTRSAIDIAKREAEAKRARSKVLTEALGRLQGLKGELAKRLSIPGAVVEGDRIVREEDGGMVPLKRWNTADQMILALKIGMKIGGGMVCVDHVEAFDKLHRASLLAACTKYAEREGVQFILASVDANAGPLRVEPVMKGGAV